jgi:serine protease Do
VANLSQSFEIILADNTRLNGRLVATSADHDLALLKLDGYKTPALKPFWSNGCIPGLPLYAIGNPAKLRNSVTSGVLSGYENGFIKTNAQIYPGNSGGPLITFDGAVAGINTFKQLTHKYEGLGFAIPIDQAFVEFSRYLH